MAQKTVTLYATDDGWAVYDNIGLTDIGGAGKCWHLPVGNTVQYLRRSYIIFGDITTTKLNSSVSWSSIATIDSAVLHLKSTAFNDGTQDGYLRDTHTQATSVDYWNGSTGIYVDRVTGAGWTGGTYGNNELPSTSNSLTWTTKQGVTTTGRATFSVASSRPAALTNYTVDVTDITRAWAATSVTGGAAAANYGVRLYNSGEATNNRTVEFYSIEAGSYLADATPKLVITYTEVVPPVPTVSVVSPNGATVAGLGTITNLSDSQVWTPGTAYANTTLSWTATASVGQTLSSWRLRIYSNSGLSTTVFDSGVVTDSAHRADTSYTLTPNASKPSWVTGTGWSTGYDGLVNGTQYWYTVAVVDTGAFTTTSASGTFKVRWAQGIYEFDASSGFANTSGWSLDYDVPQVGTQIGATYRVCGFQCQAQVTSMSGNGTTVTVTCSSGHSFVAGDVVTINGVAGSAFNLSNQVVLSSGLTATAFQVTNAANVAYVTGTVGYATLVTYLSSTANITAVSGNGTTVTYTASNSFIAGQRVTITGCTTAAYNLSNVLIATASSTQFTVANAATGTTSSGGIATMHGRKGTNAAITGVTANGTSVVYTSPTHLFVAGQSVSITGITPSAFNLSNAVIASVVAGTSFTIASDATGTYTKGGNAQSALYTNLSDVENHNRYLHAHLRTSVDNASTTKPVISNLQFSYLSALQLPDNWQSAANTTYYLDSDNRRFGTKASRVEVTSSADGYIYPDRGISPSDISVVPNTKYSFSAYVKFINSSGANNVRLRVYPAGTTNPASATVLADSGPHTSFPADNEYWRRMSVTFTTGGSTNYVRPMIYMTNSAGSLTDYFWVDGVLFEEGTVVRSWTPGFVTSGVTFEGGGLNIDTSKGGVLRLRGSSGGARDEVTVGANGLKLGGSTNPVQVYSADSNTLNVTGALVASSSVASPIISSSGSTATAITIPSTTTGAGFTIGLDTNLYRLAANSLKTDDLFTAGGGLTATGAVSLGTNVGAFTLTGAITVGAGGSIPAAASPGAYCYLAAAQALTATDAVLTFTAATITDTGFTFDNATDSFTVATAGWYHVEGGFSMSAVSASQDCTGGISIGGVTQNYTYVQHRNPATLFPWIRFGGLVKLAASDVIRAVASSTAGGSTVQKWLSIVKM